jgi:hypothetical protein
MLTPIVGRMPFVLVRIPSVEAEAHGRVAGKAAALLGAERARHRARGRRRTSPSPYTSSAAAERAAGPEGSCRPATVNRTLSTGTPTLDLQAEGSGEERQSSRSSSVAWQLRRAFTRARARRPGSARVARVALAAMAMATSSSPSGGRPAATSGRQDAACGGSLDVTRCGVTS